MIVSVTITNNREDQIGDAIRSVVDHVDRVLIVDTGVTDGTLDRVREIANGKSTVVEHTWVDFSAARNAGLRAAEKLGADWIVIVDSDERLELEGAALRASLENTKAAVLLVESDDGHYVKEKIIQAGRGARYLGPAHEALIGGKRELFKEGRFSELPKTVDEFERKCTRDVALLTRFIADNPLDPRWLYYLGVSLEGLGRRAAAADAFGRCAAMRETGDEAAWSSFKQAEQLFELGLFDAAIKAGARGLGADAMAAESAWIAAEAAIRLGRRDQAVAWARIAAAAGLYKGCGVERLYYRHLPAQYELPYDVLRKTLTDPVARAEADLDFQAAQLLRVRATARSEDDLDTISVSRNVPWIARENARAALRPSPLSELCRSATATRIKFDPQRGYAPMNPSICKHKGAIWCVVRTVNYSMSGRAYVVNDPKRIVRTENYLGRLSPTGELLEPRLMRDLDKTPKHTSQVVGYEDVRLVSVRGRSGPTLAGSATVCDRTPDSRRLIARLHLTANGDVRRADVQPSNQACEKNWMPLSVGGEFTYIYALDPTAILPGPLLSCPLALDHLRGGAAVATKTGTLCVMHEVIDEPAGRIYLHRFVKLDRKFRVTSVSVPWTFAHYGIEFCAGLALVGAELILSYGIGDREAWTMRVAMKEIEKMRWITP